jgi:glycosyltransferase involved in cell wall biosynthesis/SAM-dependent methyltransferase
MSLVFDPKSRIWRRPDFAGIAYSDGDDVEAQILSVIESATDITTLSEELQMLATNWPMEYHLNRHRHCLLRPLNIESGSRVLELGSGCGAITRYLGEIGAEVTAVEGSLVRARATAARCRDLANVRVVADDLMTFEPKAKYDWIFLIGVLEYAPTYISGPDPVGQCLERVRSHLAPGGRIVVAIENKLGLKYWNGCGEDHIGQPFYGIQSLYTATDPTTFGRRELADILTRAGLPHQQFFYPFPDYKLPRMIIAQSPAPTNTFLFSNLLARVRSQDHTGHADRLFFEPLALTSIEANGIVEDLANSFLVVSSGDHQAKRCAEDCAAWIYSIDIRRNSFATETRLVAGAAERAGSPRSVIKRHLANSDRITIDIGENKIHHVIGTSDFISGRSHTLSLHRSIARAHSLDEIIDAFLPWAHFLRNNATCVDTSRTSSAADWCLPPDFCDAIPGNLIETDKGLQLIDREWVANRPISFAWVLTRGATDTLASSVWTDSEVADYRQVLKCLCARLNLTIDDATIERSLHLEQTFWNSVFDVRLQTGSSWRPSPQPALRLLDHLRKNAIELERRHADLTTAQSISLETETKMRAQFEERISKLEAARAERETAQTELQDRIAALLAQLADQERDLDKTRAMANGREIEFARAQLSSAARLRELEHGKDLAEAQARGLREQVAIQSGLLTAAQSTIDALKASTSWRLTAPLRRTKLAIVRSRDLAPVLLTISPIKDASKITSACDNGETWNMHSDDPQFAVLPVPPYTFEPGHYELTFEIAGADALCKPKLYVDEGAGFSEARAVPLTSSSAAKNRLSALLSLPAGVRALRFDPSDAPGVFRFVKASMRRRTRLEHYAKLATPILRKEIRTPADIPRVGRRALDVLRAEGSRGLAARLRNSASRLSVTKDKSYRNWIELYDTPSPADFDAMRAIGKNFTHRPLISVIMPTYNTPAQLLIEAIESVRAQNYDNWELCIADDASTKPHVRQILSRYQILDQRIKIVFRDENGHISHASNSALERATGEWIALLDHDDLLPRHALFTVVRAINENPQAKLIYSDEDKIDTAGRRHDPYFKCDWNPELFRSHNLITHLGVYNTALVRELGGFTPGLEGAQDYDLALRYIERIHPNQIHHIPHVLYHWRVIAGSTALNSEEKPYAMLAGERALNAHLQRTDARGKAELIGFGYRVRYQIEEPSPLVSIIIPTRNAEHLVRRCVDSIVNKTTYDNYEIIIIDNGSDDPTALAYFESLKARVNFTILRDDSPFNYSALNNRAAWQARGSVLALVNNDIEVISADWLTEMVSLACLPGVGAVGAKLWYPNDTLQHGGVILGLGGLAGHAHPGIRRGDPGYVARAALVQNFSAVTGACLVVRKDIYSSVGGLNEQELTVAYNDVDFCLRLIKRGLRNVWSPHAELYHHESATRGYELTPEKRQRFSQEQAFMRRSWPEYMIHDPAYSPNHSRDQGDFALSFPPRIHAPWNASKQSPHLK